MIPTIQKSKIYLALAVILFITTDCRQKIPIEKFSFDKIYYYGIQEDVLKIVESLNAIPDDSLSSAQRGIKENYVARFLAESEKFNYPTHDSLVINTLKIFHNYWSDVLMKHHSIGVSEDKYGHLLANLIKSYAVAKDDKTGNSSNSEAIPLQLSELLGHHGYYSRIERTGNIMDIILWSKQSKEIYAVNIDDTLVNVPVVYIDSTLTLGWEGYATFDHFYPGGWTGADTLYCIKKDYNIESEKFRVSYLTHETQHLLDRKFGSEVSGWMAEYRAKLAELSKAEKTVYRLLDSFIKGSKNDSRLTHPYAEFKIIGNLSQEFFREKFVTDSLRWRQISYQDINRVSGILLKQNSAELKLNK
jgi:hypothetical protein